jgi:hypothetical protein
MAYKGGLDPGYSREIRKMIGDKIREIGNFAGPLPRKLLDLLARLECLTGQHVKDLGHVPADLLHRVQPPAQCGTNPLSGS